MIRLNSGKGEVCWEITVSNISTPVAAHIHHAPAGVNGMVVVGLVPQGPLSSGCVAADPGLIKTIAKNPADYYVNVHTTDYPAGAIRGQLSK